MAKQDVLERILLAEESNAMELDLGFQRLQSLPGEISELTNLQSLDVRGNRLRELPQWLGRMTNLQSLHVSSNKLADLPEWLERMAKLQSLDVSNNKLGELPEWLGRMSNLRSLHVSSNQLGELPEWLGRMSNLHSLAVRSNQLGELPEWLGRMSNLQSLDVSGNQLGELPDWLGRMSNLQSLLADNNKIEGLPSSMGRFVRLTTLRIDTNPLSRLPPGVAKTDSEILAYLRRLAKEGERLWTSKMLLVGQGGVGKTSVLRSLLGESFDFKEETTRGIDVRELPVEHRAETDARGGRITMTLNAWDFAGQDIYHATHQFFLSDRSLFLLVWDARQGYSQGRIPYWLDTITSLAPQSPILIVATHVDERSPDLPLAELQRDYPRVVGRFSVSNRERGAPLEQLRAAIADAASGLPLMGREWPKSWTQAADDLGSLGRQWILPSELAEAFGKRGVEGRDAEQLADSLHELGDILYFRKKHELSDWVILDPKWVTSYMSRVFESEEVQDLDTTKVERAAVKGPLSAPEILGRYGVFTNEHMKAIWSDLDSAIQDHFLKLMEQFDLSYRTLEREDISIVVERLSLDEADYNAKWEAAKTGKEIVMKYYLNATMPAGIPTWFIARSHRFTTYTHWRLGALLKDDRENPQHWALLQANPKDECLTLAVRGPAPHAFFGKLRDGLELTLERFPGLVEKIERRVPCLGADGNGCPDGHEFDVSLLERRLERNPPKLEIECPREMEYLDVLPHVFGLHISTESAVIDRMEELLEAQTVELKDSFQKELAGLRELSQREFLKLYKIIQELEDEAVPNVFLLESDAMDAEIRTLFAESEPSLGAEIRQKILGRKMHLQLYCQAPGDWHPTEDGGRYEVRDVAGWLRKTGPYLAGLMKCFRFAAALAPSGAALTGEMEEEFKARLNFMRALVKQLPEWEIGAEPPVGEHEKKPRHEHGPALRALRELLAARDNTDWGGLERRVTPEGHILWLCPRHLEEYR